MGNNYFFQFCDRQVPEDRSRNPSGKALKSKEFIAQQRYRMGSVHVITDQEFATEVLDAPQPVLVYFWAEWCGPCRLMAPVVGKVAAAYGDRLKICKMEVDPNPNSVSQCKIEGVPAFRIFQAGDMKAATEGAISQKKLEEFVESQLSG
jgi:thioredoxin 1